MNLSFATFTGVNCDYISTLSLIQSHCSSSSEDRGWVWDQNTQLVVSLTQAPETAASNFTACMQELALWMAKNCLKLNGNKTEVLVVGKAVGMVLCLLAPEFGNYPRPLRPAKKSGGVDGLKAFF